MKFLAPLAAAVLLAVLSTATLSTGRADARDAASTCLLALSPDRDFALVLNRGADVTLEGCGATVNSTGEQAAVFNREGTLEASELCVPGGGIAENGGIFPVPRKACRPRKDFLAKLYDSPRPDRCIAGSTDYKAGTHVLKPGTYCGWHDFETGTRVRLQPGVYVVRGGGWIIGGETFLARGVSIHLADRSIIQFNPGVSASITAPLAGPLKGFAITEAARGRDRDDVKRSWIAVNAVKRLVIEGFIHLPTRDIVFNRESRLVARKSTIVADRIRVNEGRVVVRPD
jgi:hypothetical protein